MKQIAILCALPQEAAPFIEEIQIQDTVRFGAARCWVGSYQEKQITVVQTGVGKVHAAMAAQHVISQGPPEVIFSCGTAGSLSNRCRTGDIVLGSSTLHHDYGFVLPEQFLPYGLHISRANGKRKFLKEFRAHTPVYKTASRLAQHWSPDIRVHTGPILTGDQVIFSPAKRQELAEQFQALAVDMESAAIAQVCATYTVPFLSVRGISDQADGSVAVDLSSIDPNEFAAYSSASPGKKISLITQALLYFSQHPSALKFSRQALQDLDSAAKNVGAFVLRLLQTL